MIRTEGRDQLVRNYTHVLGFIDAPLLYKRDLQLTVVAVQLLSRIQTALLRVLQEGEVKRVGENQMWAITAPRPRSTAPS